MVITARSLSRLIIKNSPLIRSIMTTSNRAEKAAEKLKTNPYFDKYADKIAKLQKTSPEEFLRRIEAQEKKQEKSKEELATKERQYSQLLNPKSDAKGADLQQESLDKIMKVDLIRDKSADEVKSIWEQYHISKEYTISATVPAASFDALKERSKLYPIFLFPLPRSQGYEFIMCQFEGNNVHFTPLLYYQVHKENAPECLTIKHYTELKDNKGIVLMRGEYDKNVIDGKEAQCLANHLQMYYCQNDEEKTKLMECFTRTPDKFKHMDLIKHLETLSL